MDIIDQPNQEQNGKSLEQVLSTGYEFKMGEYLSKGFKLFGADAGPYIGFCIVYFIISMVVGMIPFLGSIAGLFITPALSAGWFIYARLQKYDQPKSFNNFFDGFKTNWMQLVVQYLITSIIVAAVVFIVLTPFFVGGFAEMIARFDDLKSAQSDPEAAREILAEIFTGKLILGIVLAGLVGAAFSVLYVLAPMFILFRGFQFWDAMEASRKVVMKNFFPFLVFIIVLGFIGLLGVLLCCIGLLAAMPVIYIALFAAYDDIMDS